jgi:hypothetical protein
VPPAVLDAAAPMLSLPAGVIDLSNYDGPDPVETLQKTVEACKGIVDLSVRGETPDAPSDDPREDPVYKKWLAENPI